MQENNGASERGTTWIKFEVKKASTDKLDNIQPGGTDVHDAFDIRISWANWLDGTTVEEGCLINWQSVVFIISRFINSVRVPSLMPSRQDLVKTIALMTGTTESPLTRIPLIMMMLSLAKTICSLFM